MGWNVPFQQTQLAKVNLLESAWQRPLRAWREAGDPFHFPMAKDNTDFSTSVWRPSSHAYRLKPGSAFGHQNLCKPATGRSAVCKKTPLPRALAPCTSHELVFRSSDFLTLVPPVTALLAAAPRTPCQDGRRCRGSRATLWPAARSPLTKSHPYPNSSSWETPRFPRYCPESGTGQWRRVLTPNELLLKSN